MTDESSEVSTEEIERQDARELPDREEMSVVRANPIMAPLPPEPILPIEPSETT